MPSRAPHGDSPKRHDAFVNAGEALFDDSAADTPPRRHERRQTGKPEAGMETFRIEIGSAHGVQPGNIVGAIANEADIESRYIGRIDIRDTYSLVDLPLGMSRPLLEHLKRVRVSGHPMRIQRAGPNDVAGGDGKRPSFAPRPYPARPRGDKPRSDKPRPSRRTKS